MKRVFIAGIHHESNSFNPILAGKEDFALLRGQEILENIRNNDSLSGLVELLQEAGYQLVPSLAARAVPNGLVDYDFYIELKREIVADAIRANREKALDAIALSLHGSMTVKDFGEAEGPLLQELREEFPNLPIYCSLDMHTSMTELMHDNCDGFVAYKTAPHVDCSETGRHAGLMLIKDLEEGVKGKSAWVRVPILIAGEQSASSSQPMLDLIKRLRQLEEEEGIMAASYLMGFPWADNPYITVSAYVVAEDDQELAERHALDLAQLIWDKREEFSFVTEAYEPEVALDKAYKAIEAGASPVYISDSGDNPTAGASSDNTEFLKYILQDGRAENLNSNIIYGGFYDPHATRACKGKVGQEIELSFGSAFDKESSQPIKASGLVKAYYEGWSRFNFPKGDIAVFSTGGVDILLSEGHIGYTDPQLFRDLGLVPEDADLIICKLGYLTPGHEALAKRSILALTKGNTNEDLKSIDYKEVVRPVFPLDSNIDYNPEDYLIRKGRG